MSISFTYENTYLFYVGSSFSIIPRDVVGENLTFTMSISIIKNLGTETNLKKYVTINSATGEITGKYSSFYLKAFNANITVTASDGTQSASRTFMIHYPNKNSISVNYTSEGPDPNYYYWYFVVGEEHRSMNEHIKLYGYNPSYTVIYADDASNPLVNLPGLFLNYKKSKYSQYELYAQGINSNVGALEPGSTSFSLQIAVGPNDNRITSTVSVIAETFPRPSITYKSNYNVFSDYNFTVEPLAIENEINMTYSSTTDKTISVNSSTGIITGNIPKTKSYRLILTHPKIKSQNWSEAKDIKFTVVEPSIQYEDSYYFAGQKVNISPSLTTLNNTNITAGASEINIDSTTGNITATANSNMIIPINLYTCDDVNNEKNISCTACINIVTEEEVYGEQEVIVNSDINIKPKFTIPSTGTTTFSSTNLPDSLAIDPATGIITKNITTFGGDPIETYEFDVNVNHEGETPEESFTKNLPMTLSIVPPSFSYEEVNTYAYTNFSVTPVIEGALTSFTCDDLNGYNLDEATGTVSGTINQIGTVELTITGTDGTGDGTVTSVVKITGVDPTITELSYSDISTSISKRISITPISDGNVTNYEITSGRLPNGLTLNNQTGEITGLAREVFNDTITITATTTVNNMSYDVKISIGGLYIIYYKKQREGDGPHGGGGTP